MTINTFASVFKTIEEDEFLPLTMLFLHSFLSGVALIFFETTANTMFLTNFDTSSLPYVYILTAFVSVIAGYGYTMLEERLDIKMLLKITIGFVLFIIISFFILIQINNDKNISMAIMVFKDLVWMFVGIEFGILTGIIFNIRQGKRLFGIIMSGEILAGIIGGLSIGFILQFIDIKSLLIISIIALFISTILLLRIISKFQDRFDKVSTDEDSEGSSISTRKILSNNYYLIFFAISVLSFLVFYFIDYIFYHSVEQQYSDEKELASFFGLFFALLNIINLFSSLFISGKMLSRFGIVFGLIIIPIITLAGTASLLSIAFASLGFAFFIVVGFKLLNEVSDISILNPTFKVIYQSIPMKYRLKVLAFRETIIEPVAMGVAGLALLGIGMLDDSIMIVYYLLFVFAIVWLFLSKLLKEHYVNSLKDMLSKRELLDDDILSDHIGQEVFIKNLDSDDEIEVLYSFDALIKMKYDDIDRLILKLIDHPSKRVRLYLLDFIADKDIKHIMSILKNQINEEEDSEVLYTLLKVYSKHLSVDAIELVSQYIHSKDRLVQEGAIISMLQYCGVDGILIAGKVLNDLFASTKKEENLLALNILSKMSIPSFYTPLEEALNSKDEEIKRIAIMTVGNLSIKKFIPYLLKNLEVIRYRNLSSIALGKFGSKIFDELSTYFKETKSFDIRRSLIKVFANIESKESHFFLVDYSNKEPLLFDEIIIHLFDGDFICSDESKTIELLETSIKNILYYMMVLELLDKEQYSNSYIVIKEFKDQKIYSLFYILGFIYSKTLIGQVKVNYFNSDANKQAYAIEVIDNIVSNKIKKIILPILEQFSLDRRLSSYSTEFIKKEDDINKFFLRVLEDDTIHIVLKLSIIYEIGQNRDKNYLKSLKKLAKVDDIDIKQTAIWAIKQIKKR